MNGNRIDRFQGKYKFLSNFHLCSVLLDNLVYPSVEHAYQASKTLDTKHREVIRRSISPSIAKRLGRKVKSRDDWDDLKLSIMTDLIYQKFSPGTPLSRKLLDTGDKELIEGNWWGDTFWGIHKGEGENHLGKILMTIREYLIQTGKDD